MKAYRVSGDKMKCTSCGMCWNDYPAFFGHDDNMLIEMTQNHVPEMFFAALNNICRICPGEALKITE